MINVLLNIANFDEPWAFGALENIFPASPRVLILPLSYADDWISDSLTWREHYSPGRDDYEEIVRPFLSFGITEKDIAWINYYEDDEASCLNKIAASDIIFFTGGFPDRMMERLYDLGIQQAIRTYDGIVMGTSAGALIQLDEFHLTPEYDYGFQYQRGLGLLSGFDMEVHYEENLTHIEAIIRALEERGLPLVVCPNRGGLLISGDGFELLGGAFICTDDNLDELYEIHTALREEI